MKNQELVDAVATLLAAKEWISQGAFFSKIDVDANGLTEIFEDELSIENVINRLYEFYPGLKITKKLIKSKKVELEAFDALNKISEAFVVAHKFV